MGMQKRVLTLPRGTMVRIVDQAGDDEIINGLFVGPEDNSDFVVVPLLEMPCAIKSGDRLLVRYGYQDVMVEFHSEIVEVIEYPVLLWRIQVPAKVSRYDLRDHKRIQCSVSASIEAVHKGLFTTTIIQNISKSGARCVVQLNDEAQNLFEISEAVTLRCTFPGIPGEQVSEGKIIEMVQTGDELFVGIQFADVQRWVPPYH